MELLLAELAADADPEPRRWGACWSREGNPQSQDGDPELRSCRDSQRDHRCPDTLCPGDNNPLSPL